MNKSLLIEKVSPAIRSRFPPGPERSIYVQQDNEKPHLCRNDLIVEKEARGAGGKNKLQNQSPNSTDLNELPVRAMCR